MTDTCFRLRNGKTFLTSISCDDDNSTCCFINRIFTLSEVDTATTNTPSAVGLHADSAPTLICEETWLKCLSNTAAVKRDSGLSDTDKIILIVFCVLIILVLIIIAFFVHRLVKQRKQHRNKKCVGADSSTMIINVESVETSPKLVETAKILVSSAAVSRRGEEGDSVQLAYKTPHVGKVEHGDTVAQLIQARDEEKLALFLKTSGDYHDADLVENAKGVLESWRTERELEDLCNKPDQLLPLELALLQKAVQRAEEMTTHKEMTSHKLHGLVVTRAKQRLSAELGRQNMINDLKIRVNEAMQKNNLEELENLVDIIRAKQLDLDFEKELWYAQNQFEKQCRSGAALLSRDLVSAMGKRDSGLLRRAIQRAQESQYKVELVAELEDAKMTMVRFEEIDKLKNLHKLKLTNAIKSADISRMEQALHNVKVDGFGEDLKIEIGDIEMALKRRYLQKRLKGNLHVAIQSLDLVRLRRAITEATAAGFLRELGLELDEAHGLLTKLERIELIKKSVMELRSGHIAEIKSYSAPPVQVHKVLMALLIVLGEEPDVVRDWFEIQVIMVKTGKLSLKRRIEEYNPVKLSIGNAKRAANIISDIKSEELHSISKAACVFYLWTCAVVEDRLSLDVIE